jgi:hypothetical protein
MPHNPPCQKGEIEEAEREPKRTRVMSTLSGYSQMHVVETNAEGWHLHTLLFKNRGAFVALLACLATLVCIW